MEALLQEPKDNLVTICKDLNISYSGKNKKVLVNDIITKREKNNDEFKNRIIKYSKSILNDENKTDLIEICKELEVAYSSKTKSEIIEKIMKEKIKFQDELRTDGKDIKEDEEDKEEEKKKTQLEKKSMQKLSNTHENNFAKAKQWPYRSHAEIKW